MMTNVYKYDEINRLAFFNVKSDFYSPCLSSLSGNYTKTFLLKVSFSIKCLDLKAKK